MINPFTFKVRELKSQVDTTLAVRWAIHLTPMAVDETPLQPSKSSFAEKVWCSVWVHDVLDSSGVPAYSPQLRDFSSYKFSVDASFENDLEAEVAKKIAQFLPTGFALVRAEPS